MSLAKGATAAEADPDPEDAATKKTPAAGNTVPVKVHVPGPPDVPLQEAKAAEKEVEAAQGNTGVQPVSVTGRPLVVKDVE